MISLDQKDDLYLRYPGFRSFKTARPIHYRHRYCRLALILDTLDERFLALAPIQMPDRTYGPGTDCLYRRHSAAGWETVHIGTLKQENAKSIEFNREQIMAATGAENARLIWAKRNTVVTLPVRVGILEYLSPTDRPAELGAVIKTITAIGGDPDQLLAMLADGTLHIDVNSALAPSTLVRRRTA